MTVHTPSVCRPAPGLADTVEPCSQTPRLYIPCELLLSLRLQQLVHVCPQGPQLIFELCRLRQLLRRENGPDRLCQREARLQKLVVEARQLLRGGLQPHAIEGAQVPGHRRASCRAAEPILGLPITWRR